MKERSGFYIADPFGTYFLTFTIVGWADVFSRKECRDILMESLQYCQQHKGLLMHAYVIMSNHAHFIWTAKESSDGLPAIIRDFKKFTARRIIDWVQKEGRESRKGWLLQVFRFHAKFNKRNSEFQVWQQNNHPEACYWPRFTRQKLDYIHLNPVKAGIVEHPEDYLYSSARNYLGMEGPLPSVDILDFGVQEGFVGG